MTDDCDFYHEKDAEESVLYGFHWDRLVQPDDILQSFTWSHDTDLTTVTEGKSGFDTAIMLSGGVFPEFYKVSCVAVFRDAGTRKKSFFVQMVEK